MLFPTEWHAAYQALELYVFLQVLEVVIAIAYWQTRGESSNGILAISKILNAACCVYGAKILVLVSLDLSTCTRLDSEDLSDARKCIDVYSSYAAIGGAGGADGVCATLNINTETLLGGVCPTVYLRKGGGIVLGFEVGVAIAFLILNAAKYYFACEFMKGMPELKAPPKYDNVSALTFGDTKPSRPTKPKAKQVQNSMQRQPARSLYSGTF